MWNDIVIESVRRTEKPELDLSAIGLGVYLINSVADKAQAVESILKQIKYRPMQQRLQDVRQLADIAGVTIPTDLMMTDTQVRNLHDSGMEIGGHTMNHPILTQISAGQAREEIGTNKQQLETIVGLPITSFAYPNGQPERDFDQTHIQMLKDCGYQAAVTTAWGSATQHCDPYQIPRIGSWDQSAIKLVLRVIKAYFENPGKTLDC
jgi:peptidoglycan/xylan/chitin deacetylase (PgdA/CDA1 family)